MDSPLQRPDYEFLQPLVSGWTGKLEAAERYRAKWREVKDECVMFYAKSAAAMWDPQYSRKFWKNVKAPRFRITINKAFEYVSIFLPNLLWETPHRTVEPTRRLDVTDQDIPQDPLLQIMWEQLKPLQQQTDARNRLLSRLIGLWLNYTPREQPGGGLTHESELATVDALVKGRGVLVTRPYSMPGSGRILTGAFHEYPENLLFDPDFKKPEQARWMAIRHVDPHWVVERKFRLPDGSLKGRASLESAWHQSEISTSSPADAAMHRQAGQTNDLVVWYEIYSKTGCGARMTGMDVGLREHLDQTVGDYAYLAIAPSVPYPLNCSSALMRSGASADEIKRKFAWPVPMWRDDTWPVQLLDFYPDPDNSWPIPPLAPALGELKFLNFIVPWLANRIYTSSRDFWAVAGPHVDHYTKYLQEGLDQTIMPTPAMVDDVRKAVMVLTQPETRADAWKIVDLVSELFDKRTGLTEFVYGRNESGTQDRTAETTMARQRAVGVRPEFMQKKVVGWQGAVAAAEASIARQFVTAQDVVSLMGPAGAWLWQQFVESTNLESIMREMEFTVAAASIRRPNRERDIANYQQALTLFAPIAQGALMNMGDPGPINHLMMKWGEMHDMDLSEAQFQPPPPPQPDPQVEAEMQLRQVEIEGRQQEQQGKLALMGAQVEAVRQKAEIEAQKAQMQFQFDALRGEQELAQDQQQHDQELTQGAEQFQQNMLQTAVQGAMSLRQSLQMNDAKLQAAKAQAKAKPKSTTKA